MQCLCTKLKFQNLASGSKGNCAVVLCGDIQLIIDAGIPYTTLKRKLEEKNLEFSSFSGILITHCHSDHIKGLEGILKHTKLKVLMPQKMYSDFKDIVPIERVLFLEDRNRLKEIEIDLIYTSHDTTCSVGYLITYQKKSLVYITDTGYINRKYLDQLKNKNIYFIESNHDEEMLMNGPYPPFLKQRVISDRGHLSNSTTAEYLKQLVGENTKYVFLAHISEKNNTEDLAYQTTKNQLESQKVEIMIARQQESSPLIEV